MNKPAQRPKPRISAADRRIVDRFIKETDWDGFWAGVYHRCEPHIEAYRKARADSLAKSEGFVFI